jgi:membrane-bound inhibitor of C-type lysozyme
LTLRIRALWLALGLLGGGASSVHAQAYINFQCADGAKLSLIFEKGDTALLMVNGGALRLRNRHPASGLRFASPHGDFRALGGKARFEMDGRAPTICVEGGKGR